MNKEFRQDKISSLVKKNLMLFLMPLFITACSQEEFPLADASIGGEFTLTDQNNRLRSYSEFEGQYRIVYFGYTSCPDICSPDMQNLMAGLIAFEKSNPSLAAKIQPIFISIDPKRDTAKVLKQFTAAFHPRLLGLRGSDKETAKTAQNFAIFYEKIAPATGAIDPVNNYLMGHTQNAFLMGPDGQPIALLPLDNIETDEDEGNPKLVKDVLSKWVW